MYKNLNAEMARNGIKSEDIAEVLGISKTSMDNMLYGKVKFSVVDAIKVKNRLFENLSVDYLFETEGENKA